MARPARATRSSAEIFFAEQRESLSQQNLARKEAVVDSERHARFTRGAQQHGIDKANVQFRAEQVKAQLRERLPLPDLHHNEIEFTEGVVVLAKRVSCRVGVREDHANDRMVA